MPLISRTIPNLVQGVSQQPEILRLNSQATEQINGFSSVVEGLKKRPPLEYVAKLNNKTDTDAHIHFINRDQDERYIVQITSDQFSTDFSSDFSGTEMEVWDLDGTSKSVSGATGDVLTYITTADARDNLKLFTVADYTFLLNKTTSVAKSTTTSDDRNPEGIVFLKQATSASTMYVYVDGTLRSTVTSSADAATQLDDIYNDPLVKKNDFFLHYGDVTDSFSVFNIINKVKPNEVYNLGAQSHVGVSFENQVMHLPRQTTG